MINTEMERLYGRVTLVSGIGNRKRAQFCLMSFVALLAGEPHTDRPAGSSPLIGRFAITLNDAMPHEVRQRLKPFAPRITGTADQLDEVRLELLRTAFETEVVPRVAADFPALASVLAGAAPPGAPLGGPTGRLLPTASAEVLLAALAVIQGRTHRSGDFVSALARLLTGCATQAPDSAARGWYWAKAIDLLDRLCEINQRPAPFELTAGRSRAIEAVLARADRRGHGGTLDGFRALLSAFVGAG